MIVSSLFFVLFSLISQFDTFDSASENIFQFVSIAHSSSAVICWTTKKMKRKETTILYTRTNKNEQQQIITTNCVMCIFRFVRLMLLIFAHYSSSSFRFCCNSFSLFTTCMCCSVVIPDCACRKCYYLFVHLEEYFLLHRSLALRVFFLSYKFSSINNICRYPLLVFVSCYFTYGYGHRWNASGEENKEKKQLKNHTQNYGQVKRHSITYTY